MASTRRRSSVGSRAEIGRVNEELATIVLYPETLDALRRVRERGVKNAVASNLALP